ncbi:MAG: LysR family transcriptional regulator [Syntrophobacteraceae bacterium]
MTEKREDTEKTAAGSGAGAEVGTGRPVATVRLHLWLESRDGLVFGPGRALLLAKIEEHGSLSKAAEELGMSYRAAWGKIRKTEKILGVRLIEQHGSKKEGNRLTEEGVMLKRQYLLWLREVEEGALRKAEEIFRWPVKGYRQISPMC